MAAKRKIAYDAGISNFMQKHFSHCKMNRSGKDLIADILQEIHLSLIKNFETEYEATKEITDTTVIKCVEKAVTRTLPSDIRAHAMAEASRQLMLFQHGLLEYDHITSIKALKALPEYGGKSGRENKKPGPPYRPFATAASKIVSMMFSNMKLENEAKQFLGLHLHSLAKEIAEKAAESAAGKPELECADVRNVLSAFLASEVLNIAYGEGNRNLFHHVHGIRVFKPRKPTITKQTKMSSNEAMEGEKKKEKSKHSSDSPKIKALSSTMFRDGIRKLLSQTIDIHPPPKIDEGGKRVSEVLFSIADFISDKVADRSRRENLSEIDFTDVKEVINEVFPQVLLDHAIYYGFGNVKVFLQGILRYRKRPPPSPKLPSMPQKKKSKTGSPRKRSKSKPGSSRERTPKGRVKIKEEPMKRRKDEKAAPVKTKAKEKSKPKELNFSKGILDFVQQSFFNSSVSVGREGTERINSCLLDVCKSLVEECAKQHTSLTAESVRATAEKFLPPQIARHALALADRFLCDNEDSLSSLSSPQRHIEREEAPSAEAKLEIKQETIEEYISNEDSNENLDLPEPNEGTSNILL